MGYRDEMAECTRCGREFVLTVEIQRYTDAAGQEKETLQICSACGPRDENGLPRTPMQLDPATGHWVGTVKWFDVSKGYGFIDRGDGSDIFFHKTEVLDDTLAYTAGQQVTYDVEETLKGPQAVQVCLYQG